MRLLSVIFATAFCLRIRNWIRKVWIERSIQFGNGGRSSKESSRDVASRCPGGLDC